MLTAQKMCCKYNRTYPPEEVLNIAYLYIVKIKAKLTDSDMLRRYMTAKICQEIALSQSETNRKLNTKHHDLNENINLIQEEYNDPYEIEFKALDQYRQTPDRVKRRVFEVYIDEGKSSKRKMAEHFDIDPRTAMHLIREMKEDIRQIAKEELYLT